MTTWKCLWMLVGDVAEGEEKAAKRAWLKVPVHAVLSTQARPNIPSPSSPIPSGVSEAAPQEPALPFLQEIKNKR